VLIVFVVVFVAVVVVVMSEEGISRATSSQERSTWRPKLPTSTKLVEGLTIRHVFPDKSHGGRDVVGKHVFLPPR
jgi:hypothetical protein